MKYTKINSIGKRVVKSDIYWDGDIDKFASMFEEILIESGFSLYANSNESLKTFRMGKDKAFVELECFSLNLDYRITLKYGDKNLNYTPEFCSFLVVHNYKDGGDVYTFHRYDYKTENLDMELDEILNRIFDDVREAWTISTKTTRDLL